MLTLDRRGLSAALGVWLATTIAFAMELDNPWWAAMSAYRISDPDQRALFSRGVLRVVGTIAGCVVGYWVAFELQGEMAAQVFVLFAVVAFSIYKRFLSRYAYAWVLFAVTFALVVMSSFQEPDDLLKIVYYRGYEIVTGVVVMMLVDAALMQPHLHKVASPTIPDPDAEELRAITKAGLLAGAAMVVIPTFWTWFELPSFVQVAVTTLAILEKDFASTRWKALMRISGCLVGGGAGLLIAALGIQSYWLWSILFFLGMFLAAQIHHSKTRYAYLGTQAGFGFIFAMVTGPGPPDSILPILDRLIGITVGICILVVLYMMIDSLIPSAEERARRTKA